MGPMMTDMPMHYAGSGFPWGLLILAGIAYFLWSKGVFEGRRFGNGGRWGGPGGGSGGGYSPGAGYSPAQPVETANYGSGQGSAPAYGDPRAMFEEWHRQAHLSGVEHGHPAAPQAPAANAAPATESAREAQKPEAGTQI